MLDVALGGTQHGFFGTALDNRPAAAAAVHGAAVDAVELQGRDCRNNSFNGPPADGNQVGIAVHEAHPTAIFHGENSVAGEKRAFTAGAFAPVEDRASRKMPADPDCGQRAIDLEL